MPVNLAVVDPTEETQQTIRQGAAGAIGYLRESEAEVARRGELGRAQFVQDVAGGFGAAEEIAQPFMQGAPGALSQYQQAIGLGTPEESAAAMERFRASPQALIMQEQMQEATQGLQRQAAAAGVLQSGGTLRELQRTGGAIANKSYQDYLARLQGEALRGQQVALGTATSRQQLGQLTGQAALSTAQMTAAGAQQARLGMADVALGEAGALAGGLAAQANLLNAQTPTTPEAVQQQQQMPLIYPIPTAPSITYQGPQQGDGGFLGDLAGIVNTVQTGIQTVGAIGDVIGDIGDIAGGVTGFLGDLFDFGGGDSGVTYANTFDVVDSFDVGGGDSFDIFSDGGGWF